MDTRWCDIPGNAFALDRLKKMLSHGKPIAVVGAGASAPLYPLWNALLSRLVEEPLKRGLASEADLSFWRNRAGSDPIWVAQAVKRQIGEGSYRELLGELFAVKRGTDGRAYTPVQALLIQMGFKGLVTTNYDSGLEQARSDPDSQRRRFSLCHMERR